MPAWYVRPAAVRDRHRLPDLSRPWSRLPLMAASVSVEIGAGTMRLVKAKYFRYERDGRGGQLGDRRRLDFTARGGEVLPGHTWESHAAS